MEAAPKRTTKETLDSNSRNNGQIRGYGNTTGFIYGFGCDRSVGRFVAPAFAATRANALNSDDCFSCCVIGAYHIIRPSPQLKQIGRTLF